MSEIRSSAVGLAPILLAMLGCASRGISYSPPATPGAAACNPSRDHRAIVAMQGEYEVHFSFAETAALAPGYELREPYRVGATEIAIIVEDSPTRVSLQHILLIENDGKSEALKHWRQDWTFEGRDLLEYKGRERWQGRRLSSEEARCSWTQAVFDTVDGPRYQGWGRWAHAGEVSTWTSNETWRPLPRREQTTRKDYDVIVGTNRHIVTPLGWLHEQDNTKLVLRGEPRALAREHGVNRYERSTKHDFGPAQDEWRRSESFWRDVRSAWKDVLHGRQEVIFFQSETAKPLHREIAALLAEWGKPANPVGIAWRQRIAEAIKGHLRPPELGGEALGETAARTP
jgi:hypothetical protein